MIYLLAILYLLLMFRTTQLVTGYVYNRTYSYALTGVASLFTMFFPWVLWGWLILWAIFWIVGKSAVDRWNF